MTHWRTVMATICITAAGLAATLWTWTEETAATLAPAKSLPVTLLGDVVSFHQHIGEPPYMGHDGGREDIGTFFFEAPAAATEGPDGYVLRYEDGECPPVILPAGRMVAVDYVGLWISGVSATLPMEPLSFEEARAMAEEIMEKMMAASWERTYHRPDFDAARIANVMGHRHTLARFTVCGDTGTYASVVVRNYGDGPAGYSIPPMAVGQPLPENTPTRYLVRVEILGRNFSDDTPNLIDDRKAAVRSMREKVSGNAKQAIPLSVWLDKPDWQP